MSDHRKLKNWRAPARDSFGKRACVGRWLNPRCLRVIGVNRSRWCGQECVDICIFQVQPSYARSLIFDRDAGVCANCKLDTEQLGRIIKAANRSYCTAGRRLYEPWMFKRVWLWNACSQYLLKLGYNHNQSLWALDHIVELVDGGSHTIDNAQTLCVPCHKEKTAWEKRRRAKEKKLCREDP